MNRAAWIAVILTAAGSTAPISHAQPREAPAPDRAAQPEPELGDGHRLREWVDREMQDSQRRMERLKALREAIDANRPAAEILKLAAEVRGMRQRRGGGPSGEPMPGGGPSTSDPNDLSRPYGEDRAKPPKENDRGEASREPTAEELQAAVEFLEQTAPTLHRMYLELKDKDPAEADKKLREAVPRIRHLLELRRTDREMFDLRLQDIRAGREAFDAARVIVEFDIKTPQGDAAERVRLFENLRAALGRQYDVRTAIMQREIARDETDLTKRRGELAARPDAKQSVVNEWADRVVDRMKNWRQNRGKGGKGPGPHGPRDGGKDRDEVPPPPPDGGYR